VSERALVRLPLQVGTTATWAVARAAIALAPGLALLALGLWSLLRLDGGAELSLALALAGGILVAYAGFYLRLAMRTRASDLLVFRDRLRVEGGRMHGTEITWAELAAPWSHVSEGKSDRLVLWKVPLTAIAAVGGEGVDPRSKLPIWRLWVKRAGKDFELAETDRADEAKSFRAAAATVGAITSGQREVQAAPQLATDHAACSECAAPLLPDDAAQVECRYCHQTVELPEKFRERAASVKSMESSRARQKRMIEALIEQPGATRANLWLAAFAVLMFAAWPVGWYAFARHVLHDGLHGRDLAFFFLPIAGVLGGFLFARGRLADRRAMQLLTLGYGALAPAREGEPSRCRRCLGPLPEVELGGVATCRYCGADSIVGIDLRPVIDKARSEEQSFDRAIRTRRRERLKWAVLSLFSLGVLAAWILATARYLRH
jgi:hypothetical protein